MTQEGCDSDGMQTVRNRVTRHEDPSTHAVLGPGEPEPVGTEKGLPDPQH